MEFILAQGTNLVGRHESCDVPLSDDQVSRHHAEVFLDPSGQVAIRDLGSSNGTFVNGRAINGAQLLVGDEELRFGNTVASLHLEDEARPATSGAPWVASPFAVGMGIALLAGVILLALVLGRSGELSPAEVVARVRPATVLVSSDGQPAGSGWVYDARRGLIVTNAHVVDGGFSFDVGFGEDHRPASLEAVASCEDLAILKTSDTRGLRSMRLGSQDGLDQGDQVLALGFPVSLAADFQLTVTTGSVSVVRTSIDTYTNLVQTDAAINPGNSGGPLVDMQGRLVGVNVIGTLSEFIEAQGFAIGVDRVKEVIPAIARGEDPCAT